jgi:hypothetical protein
MNMEFKQLISKLCFYQKRNKPNIIKFIFGLYVDAILIAGKNKEINNIENKEKRKSKIKEIGDHL